MDIVVGGSYHDKNWNEVSRVIDELEKAGHNVIAPGPEWEPINVNDEFVKFKGEESIPAEQLQNEFYRKIGAMADAFVVVNKGGYIGKTVCTELLFAGASIKFTDKLKTIYFTEEPLFFDIFQNDGKFMLEEFVQKLREHGAQSPSELEEIYPFYMALYSIMRNNTVAIEVGIDKLINRNNSIPEQPKTTDDDEGER